MGTETIDNILDPKIARAILSEVAAGGWLDQEIPEDETTLSDVANYYVGEAELAIKEGMNNEHLLAIINLSKASPPVLSEPAESPNIDGGPPGEIDSDTWQYTEEKVRETYPRRSSGGYSEDDLRIEPKELDWNNAVVREGLPIPQKLPESAPLSMPTDLTELGDKELRRLHSAFNHYLGRARWLLAIESSNLANATHLRDDAFRSAFNYTYKKAALGGEKVSQAVLENAAKDSEEYKAWNDKVNQHSKDVTAWKTLVEIYSGNVDRLSREWTMRTEQYERER